MPSLIDIRRRVRAVRSTQQITKAMKMVAASKLRRAQERILAARPFANEMLRVLNGLAARVDPTAHPLLAIPDEQRPAASTLLFIITADKGLCGGFNTNIIRKTAQYLKDNAQKENSLIIAGKKGNDVFCNRPVNITQDIIGWTKGFDYLKAQAIGENLATLFSEQKAGKARGDTVFHDWLPTMFFILALTFGGSGPISQAAIVSAPESCGTG